MARRNCAVFGQHLWAIGIALLISFAGAPQSAKGQNSPSSGQSPANSSASQASSQSKAQSSQAQKSPSQKQKTFSSPEEAGQALYSTARKDDEDGMILILGPEAHDIVVWTDNPEDRKADVDLFVKKYEEMHRWVKEPDDEVTLYVGAENWPLPIPLVQKGGVWFFDSSLGRREILYRRIGENELETVDELRALVDAENEYYSQTAGADGVHEYATHLNSSGSMRNGLYWPTSSASDESPIGPYVAQASYNRQDRKPLHGYYFRILTEQGPSAIGGARKYVVNGKMTGGFAFVAFAAEYRSSGVMTFVVGPNGVVYQKDLGPMTTELAKGMSALNPDSTWARVH